MRELHRNLWGGNGKVATRTHGIRVFGKIILFVKFRLDCAASIGWHLHNNSSEIFFTFDRNIRFNEYPKWKFFNICRKGEKHCVDNLSMSETAKIYALKIADRKTK